MQKLLGFLILLSLLLWSVLLEQESSTSQIHLVAKTKNHKIPNKPTATQDTMTILQGINSLPLHVVKALNYLFLQTKEQPKASNKGKYIDNWNKAFGLSKVPWCATSQSVWNKEGLVIYPKINSAMAKSFAKGKKYSINDVYYERYIPKAGDYRVKTRHGGNHVDVVISWNRDSTKGLLLGGNVGDKVSIREFTVKSMIADGTTHITEVKGNYDYLIEDIDFKEWLKQFGTVREKVIVFKQKRFIDTLIMPATWYNLHGYRTASGVKFDKTKLTAAHKSLPLGTKAVIEYKGKRIGIEINDRCPKKGIIDLSPAVRDSLNFKSGKVKVFIIGK